MAEQKFLTIRDSYLNEYNSFLVPVAFYRMRSNHSQALPAYCFSHCKCPLLLPFYFDSSHFARAASDSHFSSLRVDSRREQSFLLSA
jgi:hypothetical protein